MQKYIFLAFCLILLWTVFLTYISTWLNNNNNKNTVFPSYIFINVRQNKGGSSVSVSWSIRVSWFKMKLLLAQSQLLIWANKPCRVSGCSCSPDYSLFHCTELKAVLLTKIFCYCICIASNWFLSSVWFILIPFFFFGLLIGSANHLHCRKSRLAPLIFYPSNWQRRTQRNAQNTRKCTLLSHCKAGYWLYISERIILYTDNDCLHFLTKTEVKKWVNRLWRTKRSVSSLLNRTQRTEFKACTGRS